MKKTLLILIAFSVFTLSAQVGNCLAPTPPMGWNSWNWFGKKAINEQNMKECMDAIVAEGLLDAGYNYFVIDGGWRDTKLAPNGELLPHPEKFPNGIKPLADYAHSIGLKFGLHTVPGSHDCGGDFVGGFGHEEIHVQQFVDWGLDFIKLDKCRYSDGWTEELFKQTNMKWKGLLDNCGREMMFSISAYVWRDWYPEIAQMARTTGDISAKSNGEEGAVFQPPRKGHLSIMEIAETNNKWAQFAGNGYWNDPDMLSTGDQGLTLEEQEVHFALWCIMSAPLMLGNDPRNMTQDEKAIIMNKLAIAVNQDSTEQGKLIKKNDDREVWIKKMKNENVAVLLLNRNTTKTKRVEVALDELGIYKKMNVRNIYRNKNMGEVSKYFSKQIKPCSGLFLLFYK